LAALIGTVDMARLGLRDQAAGVGCVNTASRWSATAWTKARELAVYFAWRVTSEGRIA